MKTALVLMLLAAALPAPGEDRAVPPVPAVSGNVTLALEEYNRMVELAARPVPAPAPPAPYALERAALQLTVGTDAVAAVIQLDGEVLVKGVARVPLASGLTVRDARRQGRELPLTLEANTHAALLEGPAPFSVGLDAVLPLNIEAGRAGVSLPVPAAGTARLELTLPGEHTAVQLSPGLITRRASAGGRTTVEATLVPGTVAHLWWAVRESAPPPVARPVRFASDVKTLVSVGESDLALAVLADIAVIEGEPAQFEIALPAGWELTGATGATLRSSDLEGGVLTLKTTAGAPRSHQFLISLERPLDGTQADPPLLAVKGAQRETGEVLVEGAGTLELTAKERGGLKRIDLKEANAYLRSLARHSMQAAFRYHRQAEAPGLALAWVRFPESALPAAVAQRAVVTTLVTAEGKSLTEVRLMLRNQSQPFLKVGLPAGASLLSADVAGERVKPVTGADGSRVPLLRPGFRPSGTYAVSFVFLHSGAPFARKGGSELTLPKMDIPVGLMEWEVFLPPAYKVRDFGGDVTPAHLLRADADAETDAEVSAGLAAAANAAPIGNVRPYPVAAGQLSGVVTDQTGAPIPHAHLEVTQPGGATSRGASDAMGRYLFYNLRTGRLRLSVDAAGFHRAVENVAYDAANPGWHNVTLSLGSVAETIEVSSAATAVAADTNRGAAPAKTAPAQAEGASANVFALQRRVAGVLPIAVDVPRAGNSFRFARPLVLDEETHVTFAYRTR